MEKDRLVEKSAQMLFNRSLFYMTSCDEMNSVHSTYSIKNNVTCL